MIKGTAAVQQDIYDAIYPVLQGRISGALYPGDTRPLDSAVEDAVIVATAPTVEKYQKGRARVLVFVPDVDNGSGRMVPDLERLQEIEPLGIEILEALNTLDEYAFSFFSAPELAHHPEATEHFLDFQYQYSRISF